MRPLAVPPFIVRTQWRLRGSVVRPHYAGFTYLGERVTKFTVNKPALVKRLQNHAH